MTKQTSEFGKGFIYNLVLFAKHSRHMYEGIKEGYIGYDLWFNASSDHFYELEIPKQWQRKKIGKLAKEIQDTTLDLGHGAGLMGKRKVTKEEFAEIFQKLEELCLLIDKELGVKPIKADFN